MQQRTTYGFTLISFIKQLLRKYLILSSKYHNYYITLKMLHQYNLRKKRSGGTISEPAQKRIKTTPASQKEQFMFGKDSCGELGLGKIGFTKKIPTPVPLGKAIKQVACGPMHTLSLTEDGEVYSYGCNDEGALGRVTQGKETLEATPTLVPLKNKTIKITAGDSHSAVLTDKQEVFVWGNFRDSHGSVGLLPECGGKPSFEPIQLLPETKFKDIASGSDHMLLLDKSGEVYSFGEASRGQLGRVTAEELGNSDEPMDDALRELLLTPKKVDLQNVDPDNTFVCDAIYAGNYSSFATSTNKKKNILAGWGLNNYQQLGYNNEEGQIVQYLPKRCTFNYSARFISVACGQYHTLFLRRTGHLFTSGRYDYGMLGLGEVKSDVCPAEHVETLSNRVRCVSAALNTSFAVTKEGKLYAWGTGGKNLGLQQEDTLKVPTEVKLLEGNKVVSVSAGGEFTGVLVAQHSTNQVQNETKALKFPFQNKDYN